MLARSRGRESSFEEDVMRNGVFALRGSVCLVAFMVLTGAKTNGCGPDFGDDGGEPPVCGDDGSDCVPPDPGNCPPDMIEQWVCVDGDEPQPVDEDGNISDAPQGEEQCWLSACRIEPTCPEGTYEQLGTAGKRRR